VLRWTVCCVGPSLTLELLVPAFAAILVQAHDPRLVTVFADFLVLLAVAEATGFTDGFGAVGRRAAVGVVKVGHGYLERVCMCRG
jgi:hypothetical protein